MFKKILLATDGSAASEHAVQMAVGLARAHGAALTTIYVADPYPYLGVGESNPLGFQAYMDAAHEMSAKAFVQVKQMVDTPNAPAVTLECRLVEDVRPHHGILQMADEYNVDLIVLGSHGRSGLEKLVLGSVATKVVAQSARPVLVAR